MKISVAMIVKNEEACIEAALNSVKDADEIIVVDTGSQDRTLEIAHEYASWSYQFPWIDDFSAARNFANSKCTGDWIFTLDADHTLINSFEEVRATCLDLESKGEKAGFVRAGNSHWMAVLHKNDPSIKWIGECHEVLNTVPTIKTNLKMNIGRSKNHDVDPERNLRILLKAEKTPRNKFYLGRTLWEMGRYLEAVNVMSDYLKVATWLPEKAEAFYVMAHSLWQLNQGDWARHYCMKALEINANMKKAHKLMAQMSWEHNAKTWDNFADVATNENVLFT